MILKKFFLCLSFILLLMPFLARAQEQLTITTYYPSPYGSYNELSTASNTYLATSGGSVGIGTSNPGTAKLAVIGGNVGIGTTTPQAPLHISYADYGNPGSTYGLRVSSTNGEAEIQLDPGSAGSSWTLSANDDSNLFRIFQDTTERLRIDGNGNVGIGTTTPQAPLHISYADYGNPGSTYGLRVSSTNGEAEIQLDPGGAGSSWTLSGNDDDSSLKIFRDTTECLIIDGSGNVGIGMSNPNAKLEVSGNAANTTVILRPNHNSTTPALAVINSANSYAFYLQSQGRLGIGFGAAVPTINDRLDINGTARIRGNVTIDSTNTGATANAILTNLGAGQYRIDRVVSSRKYKKNIKDLVIDNKILQLRPVKFEWIKTGQEDVGLIAEEVDTVIKDLVTYDIEGKPESVKYDKISIYLLGIVKEQQKEIEAIKKELTDIKAKLSQGNRI